MCPVRPRRGLVLLACLILAMAPARAQQTPDLLLEVRLGEHLLSDGMAAYQRGDDVLLPLGEMARLLTIAIRTWPTEGRAGGYILDEQRHFSLDFARREVALAQRSEALDPDRAKITPDDIYIATRVLEAWLPLKFEIDMASLTLRVHALERLPLQQRLERRGRRPAGGPGAAATDAGYPRAITPHRLARIPFVDQTLGIDLRHRRVRRDTAVGYSV